MMDDSVLRSLAKWPDVPSVYGWMSLDRRGRWRLLGSVITNRSVIAFIQRNYERDHDGAWFFQNGPQRAYLDLDYTPWVYRTDGGGQLITHTGQLVRQLSHLHVDESGDLLLVSEFGVGVVDDRDVAALLGGFNDHRGRPLDDDRQERVLTALMKGQSPVVRFRCFDQQVPVSAIRSGRVSQQFDFQPHPRGGASEPCMRY